MMLDTEDVMDFLAHVFIENYVCTVLVIVINTLMFMLSIIQIYCT